MFFKCPCFVVGIELRYIYIYNNNNNNNNIYLTAVGLSPGAYISGFLMSVLLAVCLTVNVSREFEELLPDSLYD
jgi:hypothetical protein